MDIPLQVAGFSVEILHDPQDLLFQGVDVRWQEPLQVQCFSFLFGKGCTLIQGRIVQEIHSSLVAWYGGLAARVLYSVSHLVLPHTPSLVSCMPMIGDLSVNRKFQGYCERSGQCPGASP